MRTMLNELRLSNEPKYVVDAAMKYLKGLKGHLVRDKKLADKRAMGLVPDSGVPGGSAARSKGQTASGLVSGVTNGQEG